MNALNSLLLREDTVRPKSPGSRKLFLSLFLLLSACASQPVRYDVSPASEVRTPPGTLLLALDVAEGTCRTNNDLCAIQSALERALFRGVPGSRQPAPIVADEAASRAAHKPFYDALLAGTAGRKYVTSTNRIGKNGYRVELNLDLLRNELVKQGIIRRFGY